MARLHAVSVSTSQLETWLAEDVGSGDVTTEATIPEGHRVSARLLVKQPGVVCGLDAAEAVFRLLDPALEVERLLADGDAVEQAPAIALRLEGDARALLTGERLALNLAGRLSGVATLTRRYVDAISGTGALVLDTRKTTPGLRMLEKHAVACGGGGNYRLGLYDAVLIKDNHLAVSESVAAAVSRARAHAPGLEVEVEADTLAQVEQALAARADAILLDNMSPAAMREAVRLVAGRARTEASGGITLETIRDVAESGVDTISIGALTHSAPALDVSLEVDL
jgi:nicotinate-nucleotide pyrophosphorylase (carboxylating)